ncbi:hypothetical protein [Mucilaginibacter sp. SG564]|uniref:hypothetical protein n=1 Tax=Mucilaginibacter sp. SG564 TaxID=2587022 RepID=UPI001552F651|nr:hypothetical protein [Mucilaginibacter sp. SG564]NOW98482.1 hypothetical protein [Mucilaginibacter sp. SG564]
MKKSHSLKTLIEIETVFKFQSDPKALHLFPTQTYTDTSSTATITSFQTTGFKKFPADLRM